MMPAAENSLGEVIIRFLVTLVVLFVVIRLIYFRYMKRPGKVFSFYMMGIMIFLVCILLKTVEIQMGMALGLFAIFAILRFRSSNLSLRDMTYFFTVLGIGVINSMATFNNPVLGTFLINAIIIFSLIVLELFFHRNPLVKKDLQYDRLEMLAPEKKQELLEDIRQRTGIQVEDARICKIDLVKKNVELEIWFRDPKREM
jgi:hypothetical protein